jgi:hypothetical protein
LRYEIKNSPTIPKTEEDLLAGIVRIINEIKRSNKIEPNKIIYVGDLNLGISSGPPVPFLFNGELDQALSSPGKKEPVILKILYSTDQHRVEEARAISAEDPNIKVVSITDIKEEVNAAKNNQISTTREPSLLRK